MSVRVLHLGLPDKFIDHGDPAKLLEACGLDAKGIAASIAARLRVAAAPVAWSREAAGKEPRLVVNNG